MGELWSQLLMIFVCLGQQKSVPETVTLELALEAHRISLDRDAVPAGRIAQGGREAWKLHGFYRIASVSVAEEQGFKGQEELEDEMM